MTMTRLASLIPILIPIFILSCIGAIIAPALIGAEEPSPIRHGHLVPQLTTKSHAFLAIQLASVPGVPQRVDYEQHVDYLVTDGYI